VHRIFILSPAKTSGKRADLLFNERAQFDLAVRLRGRFGVPIGEVFTFLSGLYFRGKLAYTNAFGRTREGCHPGYVITSDAGLMRTDEPVTLDRLRAFGRVAIDPADDAYARPLRETARKVVELAGDNCEFVLLGSIATDKYVGILVEQFGPRLFFPKDFIGRGDMSRGGLLLRAVQSQEELEYISLVSATERRGKRPPRLTPIRRPRTVTTTESTQD
jgi:hypothetical protein